MPLIEMTNIVRSYWMGKNEVKALKGINLKIEEGEFVAIMGHSGSGKSTLMQIMGLLDRPTSGSYRLQGRDVSMLSDDEAAVLRSQTLGFVFQQFNLLARTSALDNVMLPTIYSSEEKEEEHGRKLLEMVSLSDRLDHKPNQLSGGQQQRVAIARALVNNPVILFADEPTGNLSSAGANEILKCLAQLNEQGLTIILVTHELQIAQYAKRIISIDDGAIIKDEINNPVNTSTKDLGEPFGNLNPPKFNMREFKEHIISAFQAMSSNKVRSALSVLGVSIGVAAVIAMLAVGTGAQASIQARLASLGSNVIMLFAGSPSSRGISGGTAGSYTRLTVDDVRAVRNVNPHISDVYGEVEGNVRVVYKDQNTIVELQGVPTSYESIRNATPTNGRFFTDQEDMSSARVVLLGTTTAQELFKDKDPVGETVKINRNDFTVIGVLPSKGASGFSDQDAMVIAPFHTAMKRILSTVYLHEMAIECDSPESIPGVMDDITALLRKKHRLPSFRENDFTLRDNTSAQNTLSDSTKTISLFLFSVAAIALLVGGIGIMNIMLVSVNERVKEIGLRKAVGAVRRAILTQFLLEAAVLSVVGGTGGVFLGISIALVLSNLAGWNTIVTVQSIIVSFVFSAGVGVIFGFWPAYNASLRSPIDALRSE